MDPIQCAKHKPTTDIDNIYMVLASDGGLLDVGSEICETKMFIVIGFKKTKPKKRRFEFNNSLLYKKSIL